MSDSDETKNQNIEDLPDVSEFLCCPDISVPAFNPSSVAAVRTCVPVHASCATYMKALKSTNVLQKLDNIPQSCQCPPVTLSPSHLSVAHKKHGCANIYQPSSQFFVLRALLPADLRPGGLPRDSAIILLRASQLLGYSGTT